jgi:hypothetical protein
VIYDLRDFRLEGYLFPDTYEVGPNETEKDIIKKMLDRFNEIFKPDYYEKAEQMKMTPDQVIILASLIEREAKTDQDRRLVAAVFSNRLAWSMRAELPCYQTFDSDPGACYAALSALIPSSALPMYRRLRCTRLAPSSLHYRCRRALPLCPEREI